MEAFGFVVAGVHRGVDKFVRVCVCVCVCVGGGGGLLSAHMQIFRFSPLKIQSTAILFDRMVLKTGGLLPP